MLYRFRRPLKRWLKRDVLQAELDKPIPLLTVVAPQMSPQASQLLSMSLLYHEDPATHLEDYLQHLIHYVHWLQQGDNKLLQTFYMKILLDTYERLPKQQLARYTADYAEILMDYELCLAEVNSNQDKPMLALAGTNSEEADRSTLSDSFYLTALDCYVNNLEKSHRLPEAIAISQQMLNLSKQAMQQDNSLEQQQQYLYCVNNYLLLVNQLSAPSENPQAIADCYKEALSLYQQLDRQGRGNERGYANLLSQYNDFLAQHQDWAELISYNQHIIDHCVKLYHQAPEEFTGFLYINCLKQLTQYLEASYNLPLAEHLFKQASFIFQALLALDPSDEIAQANCAYVFNQLAYYLMQNGQKEEAISYSQQSVTLYIELLSLYPHYESASEQAYRQYHTLTGH